MVTPKSKKTPIYVTAPEAQKPGQRIHRYFVELILPEEDEEGRTRFVFKVRYVGANGFVIAPTPLKLNDMCCVVKLKLNDMCRVYLVKAI